MMSGSNVDYMSFLLRLWPTKTGQGTVWRASLENVFTGKRRGFDSLEAMSCFLRQEMEAFNHGADDRPVELDDRRSEPSYREPSGREVVSNR